MFSLINVGERAGTGLCDLFNIWDEYGFTSPEIKESIDPDRITLTLYIEATVRHDGNHDGNDGNHDGSLTDNEKKILRLIKDDPSASSNSIADKLSVSPSTVERALRSLKKKGVIRREGSTRGKWVII
jgi:predicted HTH transcriptional regulator